MANFIKILDPKRARDISQIKKANRILLFPHDPQFSLSFFLTFVKVNLELTVALPQPPEC